MSPSAVRQVCVCVMKGLEEITPSDSNTSQREAEQALLLHC